MTSTKQPGDDASAEDAMSVTSTPTSSVARAFDLAPPKLGAQQQRALVICGLLFMCTSIGCFVALVYFLIAPINQQKRFQMIPADLGFMFAAHFTEVLLFISAIVSAGVGYGLLNAAGAAGKEVIPRQDYSLLAALVSEEKEKAIDLYVRLNSLSGPTGFFTKIGITGLPLATIVLTLIFSFLGLSNGGNPKLIDFANLTLGAFLGSYVQRQVTASTPNRGKSPEV